MKLPREPTLLVGRGASVEAAGLGWSVITSSPLEWARPTQRYFTAPPWRCGGVLGDLRAREAVLRKPWLLPFIAAAAMGVKGAGEAARILGVPRRLASTGFYALRRMGVDSVGGLCIVRLGRFYAVVLGSVAVVAKVRRRSVKAFTVPLNLLEEGEQPGRLGYRVRIAKMVLERGEKIGDCSGAAQTTRP